MYRIIILALCMWMSTFSANAQKVGYFNSQLILEAMPEVKQANSDLEVMKNMFKKKGEDMIKTLQMKYQEFQQQQANGVLSPIDLDKKAKELKEEEGKIMEFDKSSQQTIYQKSEELLKPIHDRVNNAISEIAKENGYLYIFESSNGTILYADPSSDVSQLIKAKLGIK